MIRSSFAGFNTARLGLMASQYALEVAGQNLTNVKTDGYTRQRLDQASLYGGGIATYNKVPDAHIGYGVIANTVSQIRDPFIDTRFRLQMSNLGEYDKKLSILNDLESQLDEIGGGKDALAAQLSNFKSSLQALQSSPGDVTADNAVRSAAQSITEYLNLYGGQLKDLREQTEKDLEKNTGDVNDILSQIQKLNITIKNSQANGLPALELQDQKNLLLDSLSTYGKINVSCTSTLSPSGASIDTMTLNMVMADGSSVNLIKGADDPAVFELQTNADGSIQLNITPGDGSPKIENASMAAGSFKSALAMLNDNGSFDGTTTHGIGYYEKSLDEFARVFAETFNKLNNLDGKLTGKDLFQSSDGGDINALNIQLTDEWLKGTTRITCGGAVDSPAGDNTNVLNMISALTDKQNFTDGKGGSVFEGSFQECLENFRNILSTDTNTTKSTMDNYLSIVQDIAGARDGVSGVNIDEETANMMQLNKAFTAAARLMTTLDDMLSAVLGMGITK